MAKRVVFAGGIQARALAKAYRLDVAADSEEDVFFIGAEAMAREAAHRVIASADVVVTDLTEAGESVPDHLVPASAERIAVPVISADFLWPYAGSPHPQNPSTGALSGGPYPADFGDMFLDVMLAERVSEDEAVRRYLAHDIAHDAGLDELLDSTLAALTALDARSGFDLAGFVAVEFRAQNLFATRERLRLPLFRHVAAGVFSRMGVERLRAESLMEAPFLPGAMPIHPGVLRHFGMAAPLPDHRYPVLDEGTFTFEQYCRRYMRLEWNEKLHAAMKLAQSSPADAIPLLRRALDVSPGSRAGLLALEEAERAVADSALVAPRAIPSAAPGAQAAPVNTAPIFAPVDAPLPDNQATSGLMPGSLPSPPASPALAGKPVFSPTGLGKLPFTSEPAPGAEPASPGAGTGAFGDPVPADLPPISVFDPNNAEMIIADATEPPEQQPYVELPSFGSFGDPPAPTPAPTVPGRYVPLPPSSELIEVLPRMLPNTRGLAGTVDSPFSAMPETMPPPPLRPVLPPELQPDNDQKGIVARLFGPK